MDQELLDELQAEVSDLNTERIEEALRNADSCETAIDFKANIKEAIQCVERLHKELIEIKKAF